MNITARRDDSSQAEASLGAWVSGQLKPGPSHRAQTGAQDSKMSHLSNVRLAEQVAVFTSHPTLFLQHTAGHTSQSAQKTYL